MSISREGPPGRGTLIVTVLVVISIQSLLVLAMTRAMLSVGSEDTDVYYHYVTMLLAGRVPYRDFSVEYPPLALTLFLVPALVGRSLAGFKLAFAVEMLVFNAATACLVAGWVERRQGISRVRSRLAWYTVFLVLLSRLVVCRFDAAPMFAAFAASVWWFSGRDRLGGVAAGIGALLKVYPALMAVVAAGWDLTRSRARRGTGLAGFSLTVMLGAAAWLVLGGTRGVTESLRYQLGRGFEYGSLYSGVQMLAAKVVGAEIHIVRDHAAWSSVTAWSPHMAPLVFPLQAAAILMVCGVFTHRGMTEGVRYCGAAVLAFIIMGKVFSPQYLIWLIPFVAVLEGSLARPGCWVFAASCAATLLGPGSVAYFPRTSIWVILAYNVKNALFLALFILMTFGPRGDGPGRAPR
jgi:hypothetical protein